MSQMPSNDDLKHQSEDAANGRASGDASVASVLPDDHVAGADAASFNEASINEASIHETGADETSANEASINETGADETNTAPLSSDHGMPQEFTFFQKKKRAVQVVLAPSVAYASAVQATAFAARLDSAVAVNAKTQRHIAELITLMSDVARTMTTDVSKPTRKRLRRSKWLFYGCLVGFGVGWFLLFPSGHSLITQLAAFSAK
jgi:hypothetical protein